MSIILPIIFFALGMGLYVRRITAGHWFLMIFWITCVLIYNYAKH